MKYFTFLDVEEIDVIEGKDKNIQGRPKAQSILAREVTKLVHGEEGLEAAERISEALFSGDISELTASDFEQLKQDGIPSTDFTEASFSLVQALVESKLATSNKMAREFIGNGAVTVNEIKSRTIVRLSFN